jgi:hypothetical protein
MGLQAPPATQKLKKEEKQKGVKAKIERRWKTDPVHSLLTRTKIRGQ